MALFDKFFKPKPSEAATAADSQSFDEIYAKATAAMASGNFAQALPLYDQAIALSPTHAEAHYKRANALRLLGRPHEAIAAYDEAIRHKPDYAYAYCNRGTVQRALGLLDAAAASFDQAITLAPSDAVAHSNRALLMQDSFRWDEAIASYNSAIAINPEHADAQYNRGLLSLFLADFATGWPGFEWRWSHAERLKIGQVRNFSQPLWLGDEPLAGKRLLIHNEQGLGDTIQFSRYATLCAAQGATVILEAQKSLLGVLETLKGPTELIARDSPLPSFDYHCPIMSLPLAFNTTLDTIPAAPGYLRADANLIARWETLLGEKTRPRVGLVWSGNSNNTIDRQRSIPLADWIPHLPAGIDYYCLQRDIRDADYDALEDSDIFLFEDELMDFKGTAALCECMDLVLSVDTSLLHLSGALGKRTWLLLSHVPDWRWMRDREDTPWYPSVKLYRQPAPGDWKSVFSRIAADMRREFN
jgi:Tfp pilus assembly protein PilF